MDESIKSGFHLLYFLIEERGLLEGDNVEDFLIELEELANEDDF